MKIKPGQVKNVTKTCSYLMSIIITSNKLRMIYTLAYGSFNICSDWIEFHEKRNLLKRVFLKNECRFSFIDKCFKTVINKLVIKCPQITTVEEKTLILSLPYLGDISLQARTILRKYSVLNCCKLQIVFKSQRKLANVFWFKDLLLFDLVCGVIYKYTWKVKSSKIRVIHVLLQMCNNIPFIDEITILAYEHH